MAVRNERVILSVQDNLSPGLARAATSAALLNRELNNLDGASIKADRSTQAFTRDLQSLSREANGADRGINQLTGRLRVLGEVAAVLTPTLAPVGGVLIAGMGGLANQMGLAAIAGGVLIGSMQGLGDALSAMNKAQLEPTNKNLQAAKEALERLSPAAKEFAESAFALKPALVALRDIGSEALFPGLTESLDSLERLGPRVGGIMEALAGALGDIAADSSASLASERWAGFFEFIRTEGPAIITELATTVGDLTHGLTELWMAFEPLNSDFSSWLMGVADGFDQWASGLSATDGFTEFVDYIRTTGPQVADTMGAIGSALVQIVQAMAPLGGPVLAGLEAFSEIVSSIADSDIGTPILAGVAALSLLNRAMAVTASLSKVSMSSGLFAGVGAASGGIKKQAGSIKSDIADMSDSLVAFGSNADKAGAAADRMKGRLAAGAGLAGLGVLATGAADGIGLTNTASLALMGTLGGPPGVAIGAAAGALMDLRAAGQDASAAIDGLDAAIQSGDMGILSEQIAAAKAELADLADVDFSSLSDIFENGAFTFSDFAGGDNLDAKREKIAAATKALEDMARAEQLAGIEAKGAALEFLSATGANVDLGKWSRKSTEQIKAQADALMESREEADKTARSFVGLGESLNDGKVSLDQWIKDMASTADALNNFTANSIKAGKRGLEDGLVRQLQAAGKEGSLRMRQLANGTEAEIDRANAAFRKGEKAIERYNNYKVPPKKVTADISNAMAGFLGVDRYLSALDGKRATTYVDTVRTVTGPMGAAVFGQKADGGTIAGPRQPYGDKMLYLLAPGEEVISNRHGQADKHRPLLKAINGGLAEGGTAGEKAREAREKAKRAAEERARREEEKRQRQLDRQRTKDLLASDLRDETQQANLEVLDAQRRLRSARKADRPGDEIRDARLALKSERADVRDIRSSAREEREREQAEKRDAALEEQARRQEERAEHESRMFLAAIEGQERAAQGLIDAAETQKQSAEQVRDGWAQAMERAGSGATAGFRSGLFGSQQHGLWTGPGGGSSGSSWMSALMGDISGLQERGGLIQMLAGQGVTGSALEALLSEGSNSDISGLLGSGQAGQFAAMFAQREALQAAVSTQAGQAAYGPQFAMASAQVAALGNQILLLQGQLAAISAQNPITVYESVSAQATAAEIARLQAMAGAA